MRHAAGAAHPLAVLQAEFPFLDQVFEDLLHKEGVTFGLPIDRLYEVCWYFLLAQGRHQRKHIFLRQSPYEDPLEELLPAKRGKRL